MKTIKTIVIFFVLIILFFMFMFFFRRYSIVGCWKEAFFLQKEGICSKQWREELIKKDQEKRDADQKFSKKKENYSIVTLPAINITKNSAVVSAKTINSQNNISPNGLSYFLYGTSKDHMNLTTSTYSFSVNSPYSVTLNGLLSNTKYYFTGAIDFNSGDEHSPENIKRSDNVLTFTTL